MYPRIKIFKIIAYFNIKKVPYVKLFFFNLRRHNSLINDVLYDSVRQFLEEYLDHTVSYEQGLIIKCVFGEERKKTIHKTNLDIDNFIQVLHKQCDAFYLYFTSHPFVRGITFGPSSFLVGGSGMLVVKATIVSIWIREVLGMFILQLYCYMIRNFSHRFESHL